MKSLLHPFYWILHSFILLSPYLSSGQSSFQYGSKPTGASTANFQQIAQSGSSYGLIGLVNTTGDLYFHKIDSLGQIQAGWVEYTPSSAPAKFGPLICTDSSGGFMVANMSVPGSPPFAVNTELRRIDSIGQITIAKVFSNTGGLSHLSKSTDGYLIGYNSNYYSQTISTIDNNLDSIKSVSISPGSASNVVSSSAGPIFKHSNGNIYFVVHTYDYYNTYFGDMIHILDSQLNWLHSYTLNCAYYLTDIAEDNSNNLVFAFRYSFPNTSNPGLISIDTSGSVNWQKYLQTSINSSAIPKIDLTASGDIVMVCNNDLYFYVNPLGNLILSKKIYPLNAPNNMFFDIKLIGLSNIMITGQLAGSNGSFIMQNDYSGISSCTDSVFFFNQSSNTCNLTLQTGIFVSNSASPLNILNLPTSVPSTNRNQLCTSVSLAEHGQSEIRVYPNPANHSVTVENLPDDVHRLEVYSSLGMLMNSYLMPGEREYQIDLSKWPAGIYNLCIRGKDLHSCRTIMVSH